MSRVLAMIPLPESFGRAERARASIEPCSIAACRSFVGAHYLDSRPGVTVLCLRMLFDGWPVGICVFALPPRQTAARYGCVTWELARLYLVDEMPRNSESWLIGAALRYVRRYHRDVRAVVSYADPAAGHAGTIYHASNWKPDGMTDEGRTTPRCDYVDGNGKKYSRRAHVPEGIEVSRQSRVSKHRFVYFLAHGSREPREDRK